MQILYDDEITPGADIQAYTLAPNGATERVYAYQCSCGTQYLESVRDDKKVNNLREVPYC